MDVFGEHGTDEERAALADLLERHRPIVRGHSTPRIKAAEKEIRQLAAPVNVRRPSFPEDFFDWLLTDRSRFTDRKKADSLFEQGLAALRAGDRTELMSVNSRLYALLPEPVRDRLKQAKLKGIA